MFLESIFTKTRHILCRVKKEKKINAKRDFTGVFGVPSGKLLGFLVSHRGIEANPDKIKAIEEMQPPRRLKDMQRLAGCMASLGSNGEKIYVSVR